MLARHSPLCPAVCFLAGWLIAATPEPAAAQAKKDDIKDLPIQKDILDFLDPMDSQKGAPKPNPLDDRRGGSEGLVGAPASGRIRFVRLRHSDRSWDKNVEGGSDRNLLAEVRARTKLSIADAPEAIGIARLSDFPATKGPPLVYVSGAQTFAPSRADKLVLKRYLIEHHGMILGDNLGGNGFHDDFIAVMNEITGKTPIEIPRDDRIHQRPYALPQFPFVLAHAKLIPLGWKIDGRWVVYYHPGALSNAWRDDRAGVKKEVAERCCQLGVNIIYYSLVEHSRWMSRQPMEPNEPAKKGDGASANSSTTPEENGRSDGLGESGPKKAKPKDNPFDPKEDGLLKDLKK